MVSPGKAAICPGTVWHQRTTPAEHSFTYPVTYMWIDPDRPDQICRASPLWSQRWATVVQVRRRDYLDGGTKPMRPTLQGLVEAETGYRPTGVVRMLSQPRTWGWLFNPITMYVLWDDPTLPPTAAVLEVSNTPWKERQHYAVRLKTETSAHGSIETATFEKKLHVSPFLGQEFIYELRLESPTQSELQVHVNVVSPEGDTVLKTALTLAKRPATRQSLLEALKQNPFPTHQASRGIHIQAARLFNKRVPFVSHPSKARESSL